MTSKALKAATDTKETVEKGVELEAMIIAPPKIEIAEFGLVGTAPYVMHAFGAKARLKMLKTQTSTKATSRKAKEPRDLDEDYREAFHHMRDGTIGIPAPSFRSAMISACRVAGYTMTKAKLSLFVDADGFDVVDGTPLVRMIGTPRRHESAVRLESGVASIAIRPMFEYWAVRLRVKFDADQFARSDIANLLARAGIQVGIGEGRPDSKKSHGMGWGTFDLANDPENLEMIIADLEGGK